MATEEPQNAVERDVKDKMDVDEIKKDSGANGITKDATNGTKTDDIKSDKPSPVNGKSPSPKPDADNAKKIAQNSEAFAANGEATEKAGKTESKEKEAEKETKEASDTEMADVNGDSKSKKEDKPDESKSAASESKPEVEEQSTIKEDEEAKDSADASAKAKDDKEPEPTAEEPTDAMDVDKPEESSEPAAAAQDSAESGAAKSADKADSEKVDGDKAEKADAGKDEKSDADKADQSEADKAEKNPEADEADEKESGEKAVEPAADSKQSSQQADISKLEISADKEAQEKPDEPMADQPTSPTDKAVSPSTKVAREREEDDVEPPASKRAKTEDGAAPVKIDAPKESSAKSQDPIAALADEIPDDQPITPFQVRTLKQRLASQKKTKNGQHFRNSVGKLWPGIWEDYKAKVQKPVDLALFEQKLRDDQYQTFGQFKADIQLLYDNSVSYNGLENFITVAASVVREQLITQLAEIASLTEPVKGDKNKSQPTRHAEPRAATKERRQSQVQTPAPAAPKLKTDTVEKPSKTGPPTPASASSPAFAIPPGGTPQIRRDSTRDDASRPKRPIHPPKRDLDYSSKGSRKKLDPEQRFIEEVLNEIMKPKYFAKNQWFLEPVDPVALNIPTYFSIIKRPMDLQKIVQRNNESHYKSSKEMEKDVRLMVSNSETFNGRDHDVSLAGRDLEALLAQELKRKDGWMRQHYPPEEKAASNASAASPDASGQGSDDDSDGEGDGGDDGASEAVQTLSSRLLEEQDKLNLMINSKKPDITMIEVQQSIVSTLQRKLVEERTKMANPDKKKSSKKPPRPSGGKPSKPQKSGGGGGNGSSKQKPPVANVASKKSSGGSKKAQPKKKAISALEKAVIAEGINELDGSTLTKAVDIIKKDTGQNENDDGEMELDIEVLGPDALWRLYDLIHKCHPHIRASMEQKPEFKSQVAPPPEPKAKHASSATKPRKNKPMNKEEQERRIAELRELQAQFRRQGSGSQEPPSAQPDGGPAEESSEEEESDSEEE